MVDIEPIYFDVALRRVMMVFLPAPLSPSRPDDFPLTGLE